MTFGGASQSMRPITAGYATWQNAVKIFEPKAVTSKYTINKVLYSVPCAYAHEVLFGVVLSSLSVSE